MYGERVGEGVTWEWAMRYALVLCNIAEIYMRGEFDVYLYEV